MLPGARYSPALGTAPRRLVYRSGSSIDPPTGRLHSVRSAIEDVSQGILFAVSATCSMSNEARGNRRCRLLVSPRVRPRPGL